MLIQQLDEVRLIEPDLLEPISTVNRYLNIRDVKEQKRAKRLIEIVSAGRYHLLMVGRPGSWKSMLVTRLPGILHKLRPN